MNNRKMLRHAGSTGGWGLPVTLLGAILCVTVLQALNGCRQASSTGPGELSGAGGTYIVNEGGFGGGGQLSRYDPASGAVARDVIVNARGWVFPNDIALYAGKMYVAVNGSDRVDVIEPGRDSVIREISFPPFTGPGYFAAADGLIFVANYSGTVSVIDPGADSLIQTSGRVVGFPGGIGVAAGRVFISDAGSWPDTGRWVRVLDEATLAPVDSLRAGDGPGMMTGTAGRLFVAATASRAVYAIDPFQLRVTDSVRIDGVPGDLGVAGASLFVMTGNSVERIDIVSFSPDASAFLTRTDGLYYYAMGVDAIAGEIYLSKIVGGGGSGEIEVHTTAGTPVGQPFASGIFPGAFGFVRDSGTR